jgi:hypothetical protein
MICLRKENKQADAIALYAVSALEETAHLRSNINIAYF